MRMTLRVRMDMIGKVRILFADNETHAVDRLLEELAESELTDSVDICLVTDPEDFPRVIREGYFDLAFVDLVWDGTKQGSGLGSAFIKMIQDELPECVCVVSTAYRTTRESEILNIVAPTGRGGQVYFVNKIRYDTPGYAQIVQSMFGDRISITWTIDDTGPIAKAVLNKVKRRPGLRIRAEQLHVEHELEALFSSLFGPSASISLTGQKLRISLALIENQGASVSVPVEASINYGEDRNGDAIVGVKTFVKVGPRHEIIREATRYVGLVRMGVPNRFRVDLVDWASSSTLGAICYSFASDSGKAISLDAMLHDGNYKVVDKVMKALFSPDSSTWMKVAGKPDYPDKFYSREFKTLDVAATLNSIDNFVSSLRSVEKFDTAKGRATFNGFSIDIPRPEHWASRSLRFRVCHCLVHGDLHGGNLLVSSRDDSAVRMIDYATAGIGPIFADGASLSATIRGAQARSIEDLTSIAFLCKSDYKLLCDLENGTHSADRAHSDVLKETYGLLYCLPTYMMRNFDISREQATREWALTQLVHGLSIFTIVHWSPGERLRIIVAIAAAWKYLQALDV
jgi:hypothetical protein